MNRLPQGFLIVVEGLDGVGKTTLCTKIIKKLTDDEVPVLYTRQPGGTLLGKEIRHLLHHSSERPSYLSEYLLMAADRAHHIETVVIPALKNNTLVLSDRMGDSSLAYQGYGRNIDLDFIRYVNQKALQGITPNLTIYLRLAPSEALARLKERGTKATSFEKESYDFFQRVAEGFEALYQFPSPSQLTLNAQESPDTLAEKAYLSIIALINKDRAA